LGAGRIEKNDLKTFKERFLGVTAGNTLLSQVQRDQPQTPPPKPLSSQKQGKKTNGCEDTYPKKRKIRGAEGSDSLQGTNVNLPTLWAHKVQGGMERDRKEYELGTEGISRKL